MESGYFDFATFMIYAFWVFFFALIVYIRREDKREGYPLVSDRKDVIVQGWPAMPAPLEEREKHPALAQWRARSGEAAGASSTPGTEEQA